MIVRASMNDKMELPKQFIKELFNSYLDTTFSKALPEIVKEVLSKNNWFAGQDFLAIDEASKRYRLCRKTLYNYHNKKYITLHSSAGKTFVSITDLENHIRKNPLPRNTN